MRFTLLTLVGMMAVPVCAQTQLANPSFEEDAANVGNPDGWTIGKNAKVAVVNRNANDGVRSLLVEEGYIVIQQNLQIPLLANQNLHVSLDAKGISPDAKIGVRIGYALENGKWQDVPLFWNRSIGSGYQTLTTTRKLPANARPGRLWLGIYRSDNKSTFHVDNVRLNVSGAVSKEELTELVRLRRDATYVLNRLSATPGMANNAVLEQGKARLEELVEETLNNQQSAFAKLEEHRQAISAVNVTLAKALAKEKSVLAGFVSPYARLAPDALAIANGNKKLEVLAVRGEHSAFGLELTNSSDSSKEFTLSLQGLPAQVQTTWRRQVFTETWYKKQEALNADPLVRLPENNSGVSLILAPGETARLLGQIKVDAAIPAANYPVRVAVKQGEEVLEELNLALTVATQALPQRRMQHYAFAYLSSRVIANETAEAVRDLVEHGVTDIEWAHMPESLFDEQGNLLKANFGRYQQLLKFFGPTSIRLNVFWQPSYRQGFKTKDGSLEFLSPAWRNAFEQMFNAWLKEAQASGVGPERITILLWDEIHSKHLDNSPDANIETYVELARFFKEKFPHIKNYSTMSDYAFYNDIKGVLPYVDVAMPHLPLRKTLPRNAPATYSPQADWKEKIFPMLREAQQQRGMEMWSYHVAPGRSEDVLWNRAYAMLCAANDIEGISFWAYNVHRGSMWDDTDGGLLDYTFVYDGTEDHALVKQWNVTAERVVPSLRWEAVRAGLQDADLILELKRRLQAPNGKPLNPLLKARLQKVLDDVKAWYGEGGTVAPGITLDGVENTSRELREIYVQLP